ncbi:PfkB family carbohydrate kinase [Geomicrobium sediminis]|uniref:Pseudouridine kinase n=1 Tax=Geomicrobium sediminis TaxID=1347788 RepID=A0ABS2PAF6_9BACL|nr:pseudouridine kinase [Geomicrobium sediminis]
MKDKERMVMERIKRNPYITQNELANELHLSRSAVAGYISALMKKGTIVGRAYMFPEEGSITCIGGANVDRKASLKSNFQKNTSNPVSTTQALGGVARNIAESLGRLSVPVTLLTVVGDDQEATWLLDKTTPYVDMSHVLRLPGKNTGSYTAVLDDSGDMIVAFADMDICEDVEVNFVRDKWSVIRSSKHVLLDTNFSTEVIAEVIRSCKEDQIALCIAPVSAPKIKQLPEDLNGVTYLICNYGEAVEWVGHKGDCYEQLADGILNKGVGNVVITDGKNGIFYKQKQGTTNHLEVVEVPVTDATGAGDAFVAGFLYALNEDKTLEEACVVGMNCSALTLSTYETVSSRLNVANLKKEQLDLVEELGTL